VTMALKRLKARRLRGSGRDGIVRLTAAGRETAYRTALRHHLIERMLSEVFGMEWYEIHEEAERLEPRGFAGVRVEAEGEAGGKRRMPARECGAAGEPSERKKRGRRHFGSFGGPTLHRDQSAGARP